MFKNIHQKIQPKNHIISKREHFNILFDCFICNMHFKKFSSYLNHITRNHNNLNHFKKYKEAFDGIIINYRKYFNQNNLLSDVHHEKEEILKLIQLQLIKYPKYKISFNIICEYVLKELNIIKEK